MPARGLIIRIKRKPCMRIATVFTLTASLLSSSQSLELRIQNTIYSCTAPSCEHTRVYPCMHSCIHCTTLLICRVRSVRL